MKKLAYTLVVLFALSAVACGGKASEEQCKKVTENLTKIMEAEVDAQIKKSVPEGASEALIKRAKEAAMKSAGKQIESLASACKEMTSGQADCVASVKSQGEIAGCQDK